MVVICDTSPIINLAMIDCLDFSPKLFQEVIIPRQVFDEIVVKGIGKSGEIEVKNATWIKVLEFEDKVFYSEISQNLDEGESVAITLAIEMGADLLIIDEENGRRIAKEYNIKFTGLLGVLLRAKANGLLQNVQPKIEELRKTANFWISENLYNEVLKLANEK